MSLWAFDTASLTLWLRGHQGIAARVSRTTPSQLPTTIITVEELLRGWYTQVRRAHDDDQLARAYQALLLGALTSALRGPWQKVAASTLGSWMAARGLLALAWSLRPGS